MSQDAQDNIRKYQDTNTSKLVINAYYKIATDEGQSAPDIAQYLKNEFGNVWDIPILTEKAEVTLQSCAALGLLKRKGERYIASMFRDKGVRKRRCPRRRKKRTYRRHRSN